MKSLNKKKTIYHSFFFSNSRYLRLKLLKNKENNMKLCDISHYNLKKTFLVI